MKQGRNDPCACGSGKKYKNCCMGKAESRPLSSLEPVQREISHLETLYSAGRLADLENDARLLLEKFPDSGIVWKLFGLSLQLQGKDALSALQKAAELLPGDAEAHANLAGVLRAHGQLERAVESGRRAVQMRPDFAEAHNNLGVSLKDLGQFDEAVASFRRAIRIKPKFAEGYNNLGGALKELKKFEDAATNYRRALQLKPGFAEAHGNLGIVLIELGQTDEAEASFRLALEIDPDCYEALLGMGSVAMEKGGMAEAEEVLRKAVKIKPNQMEARYLLAAVKKVKVDDENMAALVAVDDAVRSGTLRMLRSESLIALNFSLGKCFNDTGDYDRAFSYFSEGCKLKRATLEYGAENMTEFVSDIIKVFDRVTIERLRGGGNSSSLPIFVLGMMRSGTTLTEQIIASHRDVYGAGELPDLMALAQRCVAGKKGEFPDNIIELKQSDLGRLAEDYLVGLQQRAPDAKRITDKMPANFFLVGLIHLMLPNAKIIHVKRNPVDTCLSCFTINFKMEQAQTYDLTELGRYYVDYARLMEHWRTVLPVGAFLDVQYEDIVADPEAQARRLLDFCGLDWDEACIDFHKNKRSIRTASVTQVRQPIYKSAVERWRSYEKFLGPLLNELGNLVPGKKN